MAQFLDTLCERGERVGFLPMCHDPKVNDIRAAAEILNHMRHGSSDMILAGGTNTLEETLRVIRSWRVVVTQRFHGSVLADIARRPCVTVHHHNKLRRRGSIPYWGLTKDMIGEAVEGAQGAYPPPPSSFDPLRDRMKGLLAGCTT